MSGFIASLLEQSVLPKYLVFYNEGVKLLVGELAHSFDELKAKGVTLFACGACTEQYQVTEKITSAEIVNMFFITELLLKSDTVINI
ncbi:DsrE family protein [Vagococcus lutrae]|nr:DsrE family protein [Vagococcus lutrae]WCG05001.1 DsrE family protein [Vagococcus lutrae]